MPTSSMISLTVQCDLPQDGIVGRVNISIGIDRTLDSVLDEFCSHKRVRRLPTFALRNDLHTELPLELTAAAAGLSNSDLIYVFNTDPSPPLPEPLQAKDSASNWWILACAALAIGLFGAVSVIVMFVLTNQPITTFGVVVDAGSSSSRVYVYSWPGAKTSGSGVVSQRAMDASSNAPIESPHGIDQIETSLRSVDGSVPEDKRANSELFLGATAGMRLYERLNSNESAAVLKSTRNRLATFGYKIVNATSQIRIITGAEEGLSAWITVNYLKDSFGDFAASAVAASSSTAMSSRFRRSLLAADNATFGSLDLGGASTQIAFVPSANYTPSDAAGRHVVPITLYGKTYGVYAYSFLCYGKAQAESRLLAALVASAGYSASLPIESPCFQPGYSMSVPGSELLPRPCSDDWSLPKPPADLAARNFTIRGTGNYERCAAIVGAFFNSTCDQTSCSFNDVYQPAPSGRFVAFSGFYYVAAFFNATAVDWGTFAAAVRGFCAARYTGLPASEYISWYCFDGVYVLRLLGAFGFNQTNWGLLEFSDTVPVNHTNTQGNRVTSATKIGWSLGYMILQSGLIPDQLPFVSLSVTLFVILLVMFAAFLAFAVVFGCLASRIRPGQDYLAI